MSKKKLLRKVAFSVVLFVVLLIGGITSYAAISKNKISDLYSEVSNWEKQGRTYTNENGIGYYVVDLSEDNLFSLPENLPLNATDFQHGFRLTMKEMMTTFKQLG